MPKSKRDEVWSIVRLNSKIQHARTQEELWREALAKATVWAPLKGLIHGGRRDLNTIWRGPNSPHAEVLLNPVVRRSLQGLSKSTI